MGVLRLVLNKFSGIIFSVGIGLIAVVIRDVSRNPLLDPLFLSLSFGIFLRFFLKPSQGFLLSLKKTPSVFIPIGILLYGAINLDFQKIALVNIDYIFLVLFVFIVFILTSLSLSMLLGLREKTGYLLTSGCAVCGVSAIAITSQAIDADSDDISISILSVFLCALIGLFIIFPAINGLLGFSETHCAVFSGAVLQITGFVKVAVRDLNVESQELALCVKTVRYLGLLFLVPVFGSLVKGKVHIPWYLWGFLIGGIFFSFFQSLTVVLAPTMKSILNLLWSIAMAAVGLNTNPSIIVSQRGMKAFAISFISFAVGAIVFIIGLFLGA